MSVKRAGANLSSISKFQCIEGYFPIQELPLDILRYSTTFLDVDSLAALRRTQRSWVILFREEWAKKSIERFFPHTTPEERTQGWYIALRELRFRHHHIVASRGNFVIEACPRKRHVEKNGQEKYSLGNIFRIVPSSDQKKGLYFLQLDNDTSHIAYHVSQSVEATTLQEMLTLFTQSTRTEELLCHYRWADIKRSQKSYFDKSVIVDLPSEPMNFSEAYTVFNDHPDENYRNVVFIIRRKTSEILGALYTSPGFLMAANQETCAITPRFAVENTSILLFNLKQPWLAPKEYPLEYRVDQLILTRCGLVTSGHEKVHIIDVKSEKKKLVTCHSGLDYIGVQDKFLYVASTGGNSNVEMTVYDLTGDMVDQFEFLMLGGIDTFQISNNLLAAVDGYYLNADGFHRIIVYDLIGKKVIASFFQVDEFFDLRFYRGQLTFRNETQLFSIDLNRRVSEFVPQLLQETP